MHFLKKMMTAVIMLMAGLSSEGWCAAIATTRVDFPNDPANPALQTPGYIGIVQHNVGGVMIPRYNPPTPIPLDHDRFTWIQVPNANNANIYFPVDGRQPTTPEAAEWSCANIDNREDSPITEWYMQMFGLLPNRTIVARGSSIYVQAGWVINDKDQLEAKTIISFEEDPKDQIKTSFIQNFRKIASTSVGRVLLYRILIEIRRHTTENKGVLETSIPNIIGIEDRNKNRSIEIRFGDYTFFESSARISVNFNPPCHLTVIGKKYDLYSYITTDPSTYDIDIFHEMNHWYHYLRHPDRQTYERNIKKNEFYNYEIYKDYWGMIPETESIKEKREASMTPWIGRTEDKIACEEIRNILGKQRNVTNNPGLANNAYFEGDDLSENLYRACLGKPLRFGHDTKAFYENNRVIDMVINVTTTNISGYSVNVENPLYRKNY